jgi:Ni/Co efflux regulator RcnB
VNLFFEGVLRILACILLIAFLCPPCLRAQYGGQQQDPQFGQHRSQMERDVDAKREKAMNKQRSEQIKKDTAKLLELATQLQQYVAKTNENILSVDVIRKADEIDKLAKSIRDKMKEDYTIQEPVMQP